jgi:hypothetical protein
VQRIFGQDAIETSIAVAHAEFPRNGSAHSVVLARSDYFADALAGGPLAAANDAPLLITPGATQSQTLDPRVFSEIQRVVPHGRTVFVLGGPLALASSIDDALRGVGYLVTRVHGANQFATAVAIAGRLGDPPTVFEATGLDFADALSAVPAAIEAHGAILLTNGSTQAPETATFLAAHPPATRYAIGGPLAAATADPLATAIYGQDLFATSAAVASRFFPSAKTFGAATGLNFPDALSGGVFMGTPGRIGALLLVNPSAPLPAGIATYLTALTSPSDSFLFGGPLAVNDTVITALKNETPPPPSSGFIAFGDAGTGDATQQQVADQMRTWVSAGHPVDALVEAGDDVYPSGLPAQFPAALDTPYTGLRGPTRPLWVALGNHDILGGHSGADQLAYLGLPALPYAKALPGVQILFLDANHPDIAQAQWLEARLSEPGPALRVVVFHQPAYSCASHGSTPAVDTTWVPILEDHKVALVINGHDHYYERLESANGVTYVVTGGGGAALYPRVACAVGVPPSQATATRHHFVGIEITGSTLTLTTVARTGEVLDTATITRP